MQAGALSHDTPPARAPACIAALCLRAGCRQRTPAALRQSEELLHAPLPVLTQFLYCVESLAYLHGAARDVMRAREAAAALRGAGPQRKVAHARVAVDDDGLARPSRPLARGHSGGWRARGLGACVRAWTGQRCPSCWQARTLRAAPSAQSGPQARKRAPAVEVTDELPPVELATLLATAVAWNRRRSAPARARRQITTRSRPSSAAPRRGVQARWLQLITLPRERGDATRPGPHRALGGGGTAWRQRRSNATPAAPSTELRAHPPRCTPRRRPAPPS